MVESVRRQLLWVVLAVSCGLAAGSLACASKAAPAGPAPDGGQGSYATDCDVSAGEFPKANCDASPRLCDSPPTCSVPASCGDPEKCLGVGDNTGKTKIALRLRRLQVAAPASLKTTLVQSQILNKAMDLKLPACGERGDGAFNWLMDVDLATNRLVTGGAAPADPSGAGGYCFVRTKLNGFDVAPIDVSLTRDAQGRYSTTVVPALNVPIFVQGKRDNAILLPLRDVTVRDITLSSGGNCLGAYRPGGLSDYLGCKENLTDCPKWQTGASLGGYIRLADADKVEIVDIGRTLCTVLTNRIGQGANATSCPKTAAGALDVQGDYCSTTKSAGGCRDSFWLAATLAASAAELQANPTDPFCTAAP